jgi:hypothetical protein
VCVINLLESAHRNFTKRIPSLSSLTNPEKLAVLKLELIDLKKFRFDSIYYFIVFKYLSEFDANEVFLQNKTSVSSRSFLQNVLKLAQMKYNLFCYTEVLQRGMSSSTQVWIELLCRQLYDRHLCC